MLADNSVLEDFEYGMSNEDFKTFWGTMAWPRRIDQAMEVAAEKCTDCREEYALQQQSEQDAYAKR